MQRMNKKGDLELELVIKLLIGIIVLFIIIGLIFLFKNKSVNIIERVKGILRFGKA